jgi:hypothetical protein
MPDQRGISGAVSILEFGLGGSTQKLLQFIFQKINEIVIEFLSVRILHILLRLLQMLFHPLTSCFCLNIHMPF